MSLGFGYNCLMSNMLNETDADETHVLLVDDDPEIRQLVSDYLVKYGVRCSAVADEAQMQRIMQADTPDILLLDIMLPNQNGLDICRSIRDTSNLPVIMLTALADESDRVLGLEVGADDYLTKPFSPRELLARVRAVLRRTTQQVWVHQAQQHNEFQFVGWTLHVKQRALENPEGVRVSVTAGEFDLLLAFVSHPGQVLNRDQLLELTKGRQTHAFDRSVDVQLSRLRKKLENDELITTVRGGGYCFTADVKHL